MRGFQRAQTHIKAGVHQNFSSCSPEIKNKLSLIYRNFMKRKYRTYKLQYPRTRQSDIVEKAIREWQTLQVEEKLDLWHFVEGDMESSESEELPPRPRPTFSPQIIQPEPNQQDQSSGEDVPPRPTLLLSEENVFSRRCPEPLNQNQHSEEIPSESEDMPSESQSLSLQQNMSPAPRSSQPQPQVIQPNQNSNVKVFIEKLKELKVRDQTDQAKKMPMGMCNTHGVMPPKQKNRYVRKQELWEKKQKFFKYYYERFSLQYPQKSYNEIKVLIEPFWSQHLIKKERRIRKRGRPTIQKQGRKPLLISGRQMYTMMKFAQGYSLEQTAQLWKELTPEGKTQYKKIGELSGDPSNKEYQEFLLIRKANTQRGRKLFLKTMPRAPRRNIRQAAFKNALNGEIEERTFSNPFKFMHTKMMKDEDAKSRPLGFMFKK